MVVDAFDRSVANGGEIWLDAAYLLRSRPRISVSLDWLTVFLSPATSADWILRTDVAVLSPPRTLPRILVLLRWLMVLFRPVITAVWTLSLETTSARAGREQPIVVKVRIMVIRCENFIGCELIELELTINLALGYNYTAPARHSAIFWHLSCGWRWQTRFIPT